MPSSWKPRAPSHYPATYGISVEDAWADSCEVFLSSHDSAYRARRAADRFREWRMCLRSNFASPLDRAFVIERDHKICLRTEAIDGGMFLLFVYVKPGIAEVIDLTALGIDPVLTSAPA